LGKAYTYLRMSKQAAPMPGDYGAYGQKTAAPMPTDYGNGGYDAPPAYSSNASPQPAGVPAGIVAVNCKKCGTHFGMPEGAQSVSCPGCQAVHDPAGNVVITVTNNIHHHYAAAPQAAPAAVAVVDSNNAVPGFPVGPNNFNPAYPAPMEIAGGPLAGYAPDHQGGLGHCCDCGEFKGDRCCMNNYFFFTLCRQARTYSDGVCDSTVGHWCFYIWCYPFHVICDIIMALVSPFLFLFTFIWCSVTYLFCCCEHKGGPLNTACYLTSRSLTLSVFLMCFACCCNGC